jgi:hypothetical protein
MAYHNEERIEAISIMLQATFEALWGRSSFSPVFYLPIVMVGVIGSLLVALLVFKKKAFY